MGQEVTETLAFIYALKGLWGMIAGFAIRLIWKWKTLPPWYEIFAGFMFCFAGYFAIIAFIPQGYQVGIGIVFGLLANNIIEAVFKWGNLNEKELMSRTRRWWNSDKKK